MAKPLYTSHKGFAYNPCGNCLFNAYTFPTNIHSVYLLWLVSLKKVRLSNVELMSKLEGKSTISDCWWDIFNIKHTLSYTFLSARCTDLIQKCVLNYLRFILWFSKYWKIRSSFQLNSRYHRYLKTGKWWAMGDLSVILFFSQSGSIIVQMVLHCSCTYFVYFFDK